MLKRVPLLKQLLKRLSTVRVARQLEDALAVADKVSEQGWQAAEMGIP